MSLKHVIEAAQHRVGLVPSLVSIEFEIEQNDPANPEKVTATPLMIHYGDPTQPESEPVSAAALSTIAQHWIDAGVYLLSLLAKED